MKHALHIITLSAACALPATLSAESPLEFKQLPTEAWSAVIPADKKLDPEWEKSLFERGAPRSYRGDALLNIGMPVGGITTGLVYLGGDGLNAQIVSPVDGVIAGLIESGGLAAAYHGVLSSSGGPPFLDTPLEDGDTLSVLPAVAGGTCE